MKIVNNKTYQLSDYNLNVKVFRGQPLKIRVRTDGRVSLAFYTLDENGKFAQDCYYTPLDNDNVYPFVAREAGTLGVTVRNGGEAGAFKIVDVEVNRK